jgi:uncharacterized protein (DUF934 family)
MFMPKLIKNNAPADNPWFLVDKAAELDTVTQHDASHLLLPLAHYLDPELVAQLKAAGKEVGVWLDSDETPDSLAEHLSTLSLVAVNFPAFTDGRSYTTATSLRQRYGFEGEIRAIGDVLVDQLFAMKRCGIDAYELNDDTDIDTALAAFNTFSTSYMSTVEESEPLFKRRA